jgi:segregation and condensation protein B
MSQEKVKNIIEAALMVSTKPLSIASILSLFESEQTLQLERNDIRAALEELQQDYLERGIELAEIASGFRVQARDEFAPWVNHLFDERPPRYSRALLETLAIIAYRQPITRGEIEEIRGVSVSGTIIKTLFEREWIKGVGHRDVPGKPELLVSTKAFLDYFNLKKLSDLPALADIKDFDSINPDLFEALEGEAKSAAEKAKDDIKNVDTEDDGSINSEPEAIEESAEEIPDEVATEDDEDLVVESISNGLENDEEYEVAATSEEVNDDEDSEEGAKVIPFTN